MFKLPILLIPIVMFILMIFLVGVSVTQCQKLIDDNGGINNIIIEAGKEIKDISKEIDKYEPK